MRSELLALPTGVLLAALAAAALGQDASDPAAGAGEQPRAAHSPQDHGR